MRATRSRKGSLPDRFPAGTRYVVEGGSDRQGRFRVTLRRLIFPDGREMELAVAPLKRRRAGPSRLGR